MKQIPLRIPAELVARIDTRADLVGLSRNEWLRRAVEWALDQPITERTVKQKV